MTSKRYETLLSIDVQSEIRKLCRRQFAGRAELLIELLRTIMGLGASEVRISLRSRHVRIEARDAIADDGLLDVCVLPCSSRRELLAHAGRVLAGRHVERDGVIYLRSNSLRVYSGAPVRMQCDGEAIGVLPATFSIRPRAALFRLPPVRAVVGH